jgi:hypothetical protein
MRVRSQGAKPPTMGAPTGGGLLGGLRSLSPDTGGGFNMGLGLLSVIQNHSHEKVPSAKAGGDSSQAANS